MASSVLNSKEEKSLDLFPPFFFSHPFLSQSFSLDLMNLYLHDLYVHAGMQYAMYGGFRGFSCEEDESLFSTVKHVVRDLTNHRDNVMETVMLRVASERQAQLDYGSISHSESTISKIAGNLAEEEAHLPSNLCQGEDFDSLIEVLELMGFDDDWWERKEEGVTFRTKNAPAGKGKFFWFVPFLGLTFFSLLDLSTLCISDNFWKGFDIMHSRDVEKDEEIRAAREVGPVEVAPRARLRKTDSQILATLLRQSQGLTAHKFAQKAIKEGMTLTVPQIKGWLSRNKKKVLGESHN